MERGRIANVSAEPRGPAYRALVEFAAQRSGTFTLVWRRKLCETPQAEAVATELAPFLEEELLTNRWPGTTLVNESALVRRYRVHPDAIAVLAAAEGLFAWRGPDRPEDLAFYAACGDCWLGSVAGEREAFVWLEHIDVDELRAELPDLEWTSAG